MRLILLAMILLSVKGAQASDSEAFFPEVESVIEGSSTAETQTPSEVEPKAPGAPAGDLDRDKQDLQGDDKLLVPATTVSGHDDPALKPQTIKEEALENSVDTELDRMLSTKRQKLKDGEFSKKLQNSESSRVETESSKTEDGGSFLLPKKQGYEPLNEYEKKKRQLTPFYVPDSGN